MNSQETADILDAALVTRPTTRSLTLGDGGKLAYRDSGPVVVTAGRAPVSVVLLHGWGVSGSVFDALRDALATRHRVIVPDLRGHGGSSAFEPGHEFAQHADDIAELLAALNPGRTALVGWSMGALVAWELAARTTQAEIAGVVSIDMVPRILSTAAWPHGLRRGAGPEVFEHSMTEMAADWPAFMEVFIPRIFAADPAEEDQRRQVLRAAAAENHGDVMARVWRAMASVDLRACLARIEQPCLHVYGALSRLYRPPGARWVGEQLPNGAVLAIDEAGHAPHLEAPEVFLAALEHFLGAVAAEATRPTQLTGSKPEM